MDLLAMVLRLIVGTDDSATLTESQHDHLIHDALAASNLLDLAGIGERGDSLQSRVLALLAEVDEKPKTVNVYNTSSPEDIADFIERANSTISKMGENLQEIRKAFSDSGIGSSSMHLVDLAQAVVNSRTEMKLTIENVRKILDVFGAPGSETLSQLAEGVVKRAQGQVEPKAVSEDAVNLVENMRRVLLDTGVGREDMTPLGIANAVADKLTAFIDSPVQPIPGKATYEEIDLCRSMLLGLGLGHESFSLVTLIRHAIDEIVAARANDRKLDEELVKHRLPLADNVTRVRALASRESATLGMMERFIHSAQNKIS